MRVLGGRSVGVLLSIVLLITTSPSGVAAGGRLPLADAPQPAEGPPAGSAVPGRLIVRWQPDSTAAERGAALRSAGARAIRELGGLDLQLVDAGGRSSQVVAEALARSGRVRYVEPDRVLRFDGGPTSEPWFNELWGLRNTGQVVQGVAGLRDVDIDMPQATRITRGKRTVVVAVVDDGVDFSHPELDGQAWRNPGETGGGRATNGIDDDGNGLVDDVNGWDFLNDDASVHDWEQDYHGTHVAGTIAAALNGIGLVGVAPGVRIMALKFGDQTGGTISRAIQAIFYAAAKGADVVNASWGGPGSSPALRDAIESAGILVVAAAGNDGVNNDGSGIASYPASFDLDNIIAVGASDSRGRLAGFSNYGPTSVDLVAPGVNILSAYPATDTNPPAGVFFDGTSMAAPHVTGVAALVISLRGWLAHKPSALRQRLMRTVKPMPDTSGLTVTGGMVNALRAVDFEAPVVDAPLTTVARRQATPGGEIPLRIRWGATDAASGLDRYRVQLRIDGGTWTALSLPHPLAESVFRRLAAGHTYQLRARAWDAAGNRSDWATGPTLALALRNERAPAIGYAGTWTRPAVASAIGGRLRSSDEAGASASFAFIGRSFGWIAQRGPGHGRAEVTVNGTLVATVDLEAAGLQPRRVVFTRSWGASRFRMIEIRVLGTAGRPTVTLDALTYLR